MEDRFTGQWLAVTRAADGLGLAIARRLLAEGAIMLFLDRDEKRVTAAAAGQPHPDFADVAPFGVVKQSSFGREDSSYGIDKYLDVKSFTLAGAVDRESTWCRTASCPRAVSCRQAAALQGSGLPLTDLMWDPSLLVA